MSGSAQSRVPAWLSDPQGRSLRYLRLSITDRCDLRCQYCMPAEGIEASSRSEILSFEELARIAKIFARLGVKTVRLTGGEPLARRGIADLVRMLKEDVGIDDIAMTTNATALPQLAKPLRAAGLRRINVSLDSLREDTFRTMTRGGDVQRVLRGIDAAQTAGFEGIKTNAVVVRGMNDTQVEEIVDWAWANDITPRFIELMPLGAAAHLGKSKVVSVAEIRTRLGARLRADKGAREGNRGPANYLLSAEGPERRVGFIGAVTDNFCDQCNRVRVTAKGEIRACLASPQGISLRTMIREESCDDTLVEAARAALFGKSEGHRFHTHGAQEHRAVDMSRIGG